VRLVDTAVRELEPDRVFADRVFVRSPFKPGGAEGHVARFVEQLDGDSRIAGAQLHRVLAAGDQVAAAFDFDGEKSFIGQLEIGELKHGQLVATEREDASASVVGEHPQTVADMLEIGVARAGQAGVVTLDEVAGDRRFADLGEGVVRGENEPGAG